MLPHEIEQASFKIIQSEMGAHPFSAAELAIVTRVIHASADFDFQRSLRFHPQAIAQGRQALLRGCAVVTDVHMLASGIDLGRLSRFGGQVICDIRHPEVQAAAQAAGLTRAVLAMRRNAAALEGGIAAVGNAPTALLELIRLVRQEGLRPALVIGVPVGFVNAVESKDELCTLDIPYITALGRKGGSTIAAAILNALLRLSVDEAG